MIGVNYREDDLRYPFWEAIQRRTFPGSVSNHHLGSLLGLLLAAYEMNHFKDDYQQRVLANAKAFAAALKDTGLDVAGDPDISFTETHQVVLNVGYAQLWEIGGRLEESNIIVNYQAAPEEEAFTAAGSLRMGVSEMTRFGMAPADFSELAGLIHDVIAGGKSVKEAVKKFRGGFLEMKYCFSGGEFDDLTQKLHQLI
jgi:aminomethyltransferase